MAWDGKLDVLVIGGGMFCEDCVLPTIFQHRRAGRVGRVTVASRRAATISHLRELFPDEDFKGFPAPEDHGPDESCPEAYKDALQELGAHGLVYVTTPDDLHTKMVLDSIEAGHDVVCMKPLCLKVEEARRIIERSEELGAYVYTEYHKRRDRALRGLRYRCRRGELGEILYGHAWIEEPKYMPLDKFRRWAERSSPFEYIGTHYADAFHYVTGLMPRRVIGFGQKKFLPEHGSSAWDANQAVIEWENDAAFWIQTSWVCPDDNAKMTQQGMMIQGTKGEYKADHADRNLYFVTDEGGFEHYNPNFMKPFDDWNEPGETDWNGYGYESNSMGIFDVQKLHKATDGKSESEALQIRRKVIDRWEADGLRAMPRNALVGVAVNEAVRLSLENGSHPVIFEDNMVPRLEQ
ncbi:MAG: Gfo/Idh/MocA family protein [Candidatus Brocadiia bacterium]